MVVLKGIPKVLSPELLFALARMGHGDEIVLADANFPTSSICQCGPVEIRADGLDIPQLLEAVLKLLPLDTYVESPAAVMDLVPSDKERGLLTPIWSLYESLLLTAGCKNPDLSAWESVPFEPEDCGLPGGPPSGLQWMCTFTPNLTLCHFILAKKALMKIERFEFYERAKKAFAVVATGETALYGNIILKKGTLDLGPS